MQRRAEHLPFGLDVHEVSEREGALGLSSDGGLEALAALRGLDEREQLGLLLS